MSKDQVEKLSDKLSEVSSKEKKIENFSDILNNIASLEDKKKHLWKEIYENAIEDREKSKLMYNDAYLNMGNGLNDHMNVGSVISKYLERMSKANDQILKLAELIAKEEEKSEMVSDDDIFAKINK
jgi:hypothetical protein